MSWRKKSKASKSTRKASSSPSRSGARESAQPASESTPSRGKNWTGRGKKSKKAGKGSKAAAGPRNRFLQAKVLAPLGCLIALIVSLILLYDPTSRIHTCFVTVDLTQNSELFVTPRSPLFPEPAAQRIFSLWEISHAEESSLDQWKLFDEPKRLDSIDVAVVYVPLLAIPTESSAESSAGEIEYVCATDNTDLDFTQPSHYEPLRSLKESVDRMTAGKAKRRVLLLVDWNPYPSNWRLGHFAAPSPDKIFESWVSENDRLSIVVASYPRPNESRTGQQGLGTTVFGESLRQAFSKSADGKTSDGKLEWSEVVESIERESNRWAESHLIAAPQIATFSSSSDSKNSTWLAMNHAPKAVASETDDPAAFKKVAAELKGQEEALEKIAANGVAATLKPLQLRTIRSTLDRAAQAIQFGRDDLARTALQELSKPRSLNDLVKDLANPEPTLLSSGVASQTLDAFPTASTIRDAWSGAAAINRAELDAILDAVSKNSNATRTSDVVAEHLQQLGVELDERIVAENLSRQREFDLASALSLGFARDWQADLKTGQQQLLSVCDRLSAAPSLAEIESPAATFDTSTAGLATVTASLEQEAKLLVSALPAATLWAAQFSDSREGVSDSEWVSLLGKAATDPAGLLRNTEAKSRPKPGQSTEELLRFLIVRAIAAIHQIRFDTRADGQSASQIADARLAEVALLQNLRKQFADTVAKYVVELTASTPEDPALRRTLRRSVAAAVALPQLSAKQRDLLSRKLVELDEAIKDSGVSASDESAAESNQRIAWEQMWLNSWMRLLGDDGFASADGGSVAAKKPARPRSPQPPASRENVSSEKSLAAYGLSVRDYWRASRNRLIAICEDLQADRLDLLQDVDRVTRIVPAHDADRLIIKGLDAVEIRSHVEQFDYAISQAELAARNGWVRASDRTPYNEFGWYAQNCRQWLQLAESLRGELLDDLRKLGVDRSQSGEIDPWSKRIEATRKSLASHRDPQFTVATDVPEMFLGDEQIKNAEIPVSIQVERPGYQWEGLARVRFRPDSDDAKINVDGGVALSLDQPDAQHSVLISRPGDPFAGTNAQPDATVRAEFFFRGRTSKQANVAKLDLNSRPEFVDELIPRPSEAIVHVSGSDSRPIVFVLDWSRSMRRVLESSKGSSNGIEKTRKQVALETFRAMLSSEYFTKDTRASLVVYGHRFALIDSTSKKKRSNQSFINSGLPGADRVEQDAKNIGVLNDIDTLVAETRLDADGKFDFFRTLERLETVEPFGVTPLVQSVVTAMRDNLKGRPGIVIAITDGNPNDDNDTVVELHNLLRNNPDTRVEVIAFDMEDDKNAKLTLDEVFPPELGVEPHKAPDAEQLLESMKDSLDPLRYSVNTRNAPKVSASEKLDAEIRIDLSTSSATDEAAYDVTYGQISTQRPGNSLLDRPLLLRRGDTAGLRIDWDLNQFKFLRSFDTSALNYKSRAAGVGSGAARNGIPTMMRAVAVAAWEASAAASADGKTVRADVMLDHSDLYQIVRQPAWIELAVRQSGIDVRPKLFRRESAQRWNSTLIGAPAWELRCSPWDARSDVKVDAWWSMTPPTPSRVAAFQKFTKDIPDEQRVIGGSGTELPKCVVLVRRLDDRNTVQVRLDEVADALNSVSLGQPDPDIRVAIGRRDTTADRASFLPIEVKTRIRQRSGRRNDIPSTRIYEFEGENIPDNANLDIAFYSGEKLRSEAIHLEQPLVIRRRN